MKIMGLDNEINGALAQAFATTMLNVINESHLHTGHAGDDGSGESHWRIEISTPEFAQMSRIARHRAIHTALGPAVIGRIHALSIDIV